MNIFRLIIKSSSHYFGRNILVAFGIAVCTSVITGGLITGNSIRFSLEQSTYYRLGNITHVASSPDRYFRSALAYDLQSQSEIDVAPALILHGFAITDGGRKRINNIQIIGIDDSFFRVAGRHNQNRGSFVKPDIGVQQAENLLFTDGNDIIVSENTADFLGIGIGQAITLGISKASLFPKNAPFVSETEPVRSIHTNVKSIVTKDNLGYFNLKNSQSTPYNVFISLDRLNKLMEFEGRANHLLFSAESSETDDLVKLLNSSFKSIDAGLISNKIEHTNEIEISSERVFIEDTVVDAFKCLPGVRFILSYFVNSIEFNHKLTPYSFASSLPDDQLNPDEIVINEWLAVDLSAGVGDRVKLTYYEIGELRQLKVNSVELTVKSIVPITGNWADGMLMPNIPGLSDAGHCRDWEAGIPINLNSIRPKDEAYWNKYKGIPKLFVSNQLAHKLWSNRYGSYTAIRFPASGYDKGIIDKVFKNKLHPANFGIIMHEVRNQGIKAARNGVDFSQLFIGLSFFLLLAAIILTSLLLRLNLDTRTIQFGTLIQIGFRRNQITWIFLLEGIFFSIIGVLIGLGLAVVYTKIIFLFLNSLWWDIVRTNVLLINLDAFTLVAGAIVSLIISIIAIFITVKIHINKTVLNLHKPDAKLPNKRWQSLKLAISAFLFFVSLSLVLFQFFILSNREPLVFFLSGGLLLFSSLLFTDFVIKKQSLFYKRDFNFGFLSWCNIKRNHNQSLTIIILFSLGTYLVVSTGANRKDMFAGAVEKNGGTGGFRYFAQTSIPVLFDLNDMERRAVEGLPDSFSIVQFSKIEGDDASCLNLNRTSNPAILGVNSEKLFNRFTFVTRTNDLDKNNPWKSLEKELDGGVIPAIADQTVIQWGLGKEVGDTLKYRGESGDTIQVKLIGGLSPSLFQGYIIISSKHLIKNYPSHSGSSVFLVFSEGDDLNDPGIELTNLLRDNGWEMTTATQRLAGFYSVTNTYLSVFLVLGTLGLILGTMGLAVVLARAIIERQSELAIMQAIGFSKTILVKMLVIEYSYLLLTGVGIGFISAVVSVLPAILSENTTVSYFTVFSFGAIILINGVTWILLLAIMQVKPVNLTARLKKQ